jgi:hypothetical protein
MRDMLYLVPLGIGGVILIMAMRHELPRGEGMNRQRYGLAMIFAAIFIAAANALLLSMERKFYVVLEFSTIFVFFMGLAYLLSPPRGQGGPKAHGVAAHIIMGVGVLLGLAHVVALKATVEWPVRLITFYRALRFPEQ